MRREMRKERDGARVTKGLYEAPLAVSLGASKVQGQGAYCTFGSGATSLCTLGTAAGVTCTTGPSIS